MADCMPPLETFMEDEHYESNVSCTSLELESYRAESQLKRTVFDARRTQVAVRREVRVVNARETSHFLKLCVVDELMKIERSHAYSEQQLAFRCAYHCVIPQVSRAIVEARAFLDGEWRLRRAIGRNDAPAERSLGNALGLICDL